MIGIWILLYILLFLFFTAALILIIPLEYAASGEKFETSYFKIEFSWMFKTIRGSVIKESDTKIEYLLIMFGHKIAMKKHKKHKNEKEKTVRGKKKRIIKTKNPQAGRFINRDFLFKTLSLIKKIFNMIKPYQAEIKGRYGFEDPFNTAVCSIITSMLNSGGSSEAIKIVPVFDEEILEGRFLVRGRIVPGLAVIPVTRFMLYKSVRNVLF